MTAKSAAGGSRKLPTIGVGIQQALHAAAQVLVAGTSLLQVGCSFFRRLLRQCGREDRFEVQFCGVVHEIIRICLHYQTMRGKCIASLTSPRNSFQVPGACGSSFSSQYSRTRA